MSSLANKIVLIVGGAAGIGESTARQCQSQGGQVIIADREAGRGGAVAAAIGAPFFQVDVTDEASVTALFGQVEKQFGHLDVLIQTAGILQGAYLPIEEFTVEMYKRVIDVNVVGSFLCAKHAVPLLKKAGKGVIILVSSLAAVTSSSSYAYGSSKGGVNGLGLTMEKKLASENIRVNVVMPGNIDTNMKRSVIEQEAVRAGQPVEAAVAAYALGEPMGVGKVLAWLASDDADYVRGMIATR
jgi:3alpha(or 20beta)-hydroxysteroid dehydrogenase